MAYGVDIPCGAFGQVYLNMGFDATSKLKTSSVREVAKFLELLGYRRHKGVKSCDANRALEYVHFNETDYRSHQPVFATIVASPGRVEVHTRCLMARSRYDAQFHNSTIRQLQKRFGGSFSTGRGKNVLFEDCGEERFNADSGCYLATWRFHGRLFLVQSYLVRRRFENDCDFVPEFSSVILSNHLLIPFVVAAIECWFREVYEALLRYSPRKAEVLRGENINAGELVDEAGEAISVERAVARRKPFQDAGRAFDTFKRLDSKLDLHGSLSRRTRKRKTCLCTRFACFLQRRHRTIHGAEIDVQYTTKLLSRDIADIRACIIKLYEAILDRHGWCKDYVF